MCVSVCGGGSVYVLSVSAREELASHAKPLSANKLTLINNVFAFYRNRCGGYSFVVRCFEQMFLMN